MKILSRLFFLFSLPAFLLHPISSHASCQTPIPIRYISYEAPRDEDGKVNPWILFHPDYLSIDKYFAFIELTENEAFLGSLTEEEFDLVVDFVTYVVQSSVPENLKDAYTLEIDQLMEDLYGEDQLSLSFLQEINPKIYPAYFFQNPEFLLCKSWLKRKIHHFGHWCSKHKGPLIIGAVVVGAVAVAALTGGVGGSSAVAVGGGIISEQLSNDDPKPIN
ncbi:MAG: hypothetical protein KDK76_00770, partial [Chlamydiia bacterium]|nr:hypothetical protein [Chlamydiia bacterium]